MLGRMNEVNNDLFYLISCNVFFILRIKLR